MGTPKANFLSFPSLRDLLTLKTAVVPLHTYAIISVRVGVMWVPGVAE